MGRIILGKYSIKYFKILDQKFKISFQGTKSRVTLFNIFLGSYDCGQVIDLVRLSCIVTVDKWAPAELSKDFIKDDGLAVLQMNGCTTMENIFEIVNYRNALSTL